MTEEKHAEEINSERMRYLINIDRMLYEMLESRSTETDSNCLEPVRNEGAIGFGVFMEKPVMAKSCNY